MYITEQVGSRAAGVGFNNLNSRGFSNNAVDRFVNVSTMGNDLFTGIGKQAIIT